MVTEDEVIGWHHRLNGHEFEQTLGDSEGQGKPGVLQSMGLQRVRYNLTTEQQESKPRKEERHVIDKKIQCRKDKDYPG